MIGLIVAMFADIPLEPRADVSVSGTPQWGMIVSGLAISAAVVILGIVLVRRRNKKD